MPPRLYRGRAAYYDVLNEDKDHAGEAAFVADRFDEYADTDTRRALVVGCGTGSHAPHLIEHGFEVTGVDPSEEMLDIARQKSDARFETGELPDLLLEEAFDLVFLPFTIVNHLDRERLEESVGELGRVLADGGVLILDNGRFDIGDGDAVTVPFIETVADGDEDVARIAQLQEEEGDRIRWESVILTPDGFFVDSHDLYPHRDEYIEQLLLEKGYPVEQYEEGYGTESPKDDGTVFVAWLT